HELYVMQVNPVFLDCAPQIYSWVFGTLLSLLYQLCGLLTNPAPTILLNSAKWFFTSSPANSQDY
ncbi:MAG: hypothetical protein Q8T08_24010, partial [Ignavibacteria bacterium]|nr:hypothetical protein [Ignavibacteria bacterium]